MHHFDARIQTALAREHAERLRLTMQTGRRPKQQPNSYQGEAVSGETASFRHWPSAVRRTAL